MMEEEEASEKNGRDPHFWSDDSGHQLLPQVPSVSGSLGPPDTGCHHE